MTSQIMKIFRKLTRFSKIGKSGNRIRDVTNLCEKFSITKASTPTKFEGICDDITEVIVILVF